MSKAAIDKQEISSCVGLIVHILYTYIYINSNINSLLYNILIKYAADRQLLYITKGNRPIGTSRPYWLKPL